MIDTFILGAGFSKSGGAPDEDEIVPSVFSSNKNQLLKNAIEEILYPHNPNWVKTSTIQEILSRLDLIKNFRPYPKLDYQLVERTEEELISEIAKTLQPSIIQNNPYLYERFVSLFWNTSNIMSFNYDLLLEKALTAVGLKFNLGFEAYCLHGKPCYAKEGKNFIKLHGSINLFFCPKCKNIFCSSDSSCQAHGPRLYHNCPFCHDSVQRLKRFMVAPTLYKTYDLPVLRTLWFAALQTLINSRRLCFIGYSLSDADILVCQMLDTAFRMSNNRQSVWLVNGPRHNPKNFQQIYGENLNNTKMYFNDWFKQINLNGPSS